MVTGINHLTFSVKDLEESFDFYTRVLGCRPVARWDEGAYLMAGDVWITLIPGEASRDGSPGVKTHVAFSVSADDFATVSERVTESGAEIWQENRTEGDSVYFTDPAGNKLEIRASDFEARLRMERRNPPRGMQFYS